MNELMNCHHDASVCRNCTTYMLYTAYDNGVPLIMITALDFGRQNDEKAHNWLPGLIFKNNWHDIMISIGGFYLNFRLNTNCMDISLNNDGSSVLSRPRANSQLRFPNLHPPSRDNRHRGW